MATVEEQVKDLNAQRQNAWEQGKAVLDRAMSEKRAMTADEQQTYDRTSDEVTRLANTRDALISSDGAQRELETVNEELRRVATPGERADADRRDAQLEQEIRSFFRPEVHTKGTMALELDLTVPARIYDMHRNGIPLAELRAVIATDTGASGGSLTVPTTVASSVYAYMTAQTAMRRIGCTIITTDSGNAMNFPKIATHGIGTQVATQDTAFAGTDPVLGQMTLNAYDYGQLCAVASDMLEDSGVDVLSFVTRQIGRAVGQVTGTDYVTGSGSSKPNGVMTALGGAGTIASGESTSIGGTLGRSVEKLIDLQYSVVDSYRNNGAAWLMKDSTGATIRKLRDGAGGTSGQFLWQPSPTVGLIGGQPDTFLGDPVYFDVNVAAMASDAKTIAYGDFSAYYIRDTRQFRLERSDDLLFNKNQVAFRGILRTDGDLIDSNAINVLHQAPA